MSLLPKEKTKPKNDFAKFTTLIYGAPKVGKTTLASQFDSPLFLATEAGLNALEAFEVSVDSWKNFLAVCEELSEGKHEFKTIVIDTVDNLFKFCSQYICKKHNIQHESDMNWGKGWNFVKDEFFKAITKLSHMKTGLVIISHAEPMEIVTRTGNITKWMPTMNKRAKEIIMPLCDFIFFATSEVIADGEQRILRCRPSQNWDAGVRFKGWAETLPMSYEAIKAEFEKCINNKIESEGKAV